MTNWSLLAQVTVPVACIFIGAIVNKLVERRPRLIVYYGHASSFQVPGQAGNPSFGINTHSIIIRNTGRLAANNVRVGHNYLPPNHTVFPVVSHTRQIIPGGGEEILFPVMVAGEQIIISYLYFPPLTWNQIATQVRSDEGFATGLNVIPTPQRPWWHRALLTSLQLAGAVAILYLMAELIRWSYERWV